MDYRLIPPPTAPPVRGYLPPSRVIVSHPFFTIGWVLRDRILAIADLRKG